MIEAVPRAVEDGLLLTSVTGAQAVWSTLREAFGYPSGDAILVCLGNELEWVALEDTNIVIGGE